MIKYAASLFPDHYIHLGGDEMNLTDWTSEPHIAAYLKHQHPGLSPIAAAQAEAYGSFVAKLHQIAARYNRLVIHWEDVFDWAGPVAGCGGVQPTLSNASIVQMFREGFGDGLQPCQVQNKTSQQCVCGSNDAATTKAVVEAGYRAIWNNPSAWHLDYYAYDKNPGWHGGFESWQHVYAQEPFLCPNASTRGCGTGGPEDIAITDPEQQVKKRNAVVLSRFPF